MIEKLLIVGVAILVSSPSRALTTFDGNIALGSSATFDGNMSVIARGGEYMTSKGHEMTTTKKQREVEKSRAESYAGHSELQADYMIDERKNGKFKSGSVTFDTSYFASIPGGATKADDLATIVTTDKIKITAAKISGGKIESFNFRATNWYPDTEAGGNSIIDKGIKGKIDFADGTATLEAAYKLKGDGAVDRFKFTGDMVVPGPAIVAGVPETSTWAMLLVGFAGLGFASYRRASRESGPLRRESNALSRERRWVA